MNIVTARTWARQQGRNATGDTTFYDDTKIDMALMLAMDEFARLSRGLSKNSTIALSSGSAALPTLPTNFRPQRLLRAYLTGSNIQVDTGGGWDDRWAYTSRGGPISDPSGQFNGGRQTALEVVTFEQLKDYEIAITRSGQPTMIAFDAFGTGRVQPTPDQDYSLVLRWDEPATTWTPGMPVTSLTIAAGIVTAVAFIGGGNIYQAAPTLVVSGDGSGANVTATVTNQKITALAVGAGGTLYTTAKLLIDGADTTDQTINVPEDWLRTIIAYGVPNFLHQTEPEAVKFATQCYQKFEAFCRELAGAGGLGANSVATPARQWG